MAAWESGCQGTPSLFQCYVETLHNEHARVFENRHKIPNTFGAARGHAHSKVCVQSYTVSLFIGYTDHNDEV